MAALKHAPAKHYVREWEAYPDLFVFAPTCQYPGFAALRVARMISEQFNLPMPAIHVNPRRHQTCVCECELDDTGKVYKLEVDITLCGGFSVGQFLHEMAHAWCFHVAGDHDHGETFRYYADRLYNWFRLEDKAQAAFFP